MGPRSSGRSRESDGQSVATRRERDQYDLLTAAALGLVAGAGLAILFRRGPRGKRPVAALARADGSGAAVAGRAGGRGARWAANRGGELWDAIPFDDIGESLGEYVQAAREAIDETVSQELKDLRKSMRHHRRRLGL
jgi:hypothetical protein